MSKPTGLDNIWASTGSTTDPGETKELLGYVAEIPSYQSLNFILNKHSSALDNLNSWGILEWDILTTYSEGAKVMYSGETYTLVTSTDTGTTPDTDSAIWLDIEDYLTTNVETNIDSISYMEAYDYVIDSDAKFQALCDETITSVTSVYIAAGTWTATDGSNWDLTATSTKRLKGSSGSLLSGNVGGTTLDNTSALISYQSSEDQTNFADYYHIGVNAINTNTLGKYSSCYCNIYNMTNCNGSIEDLNTTGDYSGTHCFRNCYYLHNCTGYAVSSITLNGGISVGFSSCDYITSSQGEAIGIQNSTGNGYGAGFLSCSYVVTCLGTGYNSDTTAGYGFRSCTSVIYPSFGASTTANASISTGIQTENTIV